jgi:apolipoprotein D and lipocalin family protein
MRLKKKMLRMQSAEARDHSSLANEAQKEYIKHPHPKPKIIINYLQTLSKIVIVSLFFSIFTTTSMSQKLQTVPYVDLKKYVGKWYEIASFPQRFQKGCNCTTAEYTLTDKGFVIVENRCNKDSINGKQSYIKGKAFIVENSGNAKLKVQFFWPFKGKYWIIDLADDYSYAVVGHPNKKYLWILSRTPMMNEIIYQQIISRVKEKGFDISKIKLTKQI